MFGQSPAIDFIDQMWGMIFKLTFVMLIMLLMLRGQPTPAKCMKLRAC